MAADRISSFTFLNKYDQTAERTLLLAVISLMVAMKTVLYVFHEDCLTH